MTSAPDPQPSPQTRPSGRRGAGVPSLWALLAFGLICLLAGIGVADFAPKLMAPPQKVAGLLAPSAPAASKAADPVVGPIAPPPPSLAQLSAKVESLEAQQSAARETAAAAVAAATLLDAAQSSHPFTRELASLKAVAPPSADLAALEKLAATGAPSRAALAMEFPIYAAQAKSAAPRSGSKFWTAVSAVSSRFISLRRVDRTEGSSVDAILARAEQKMNDGDVDQALRLVDTLPAASRAAMDPWRALALDRAELDRRVSAVRLQAVESLARLSEGGA